MGCGSSSSAAGVSDSSGAGGAGGAATAGSTSFAAGSVDWTAIHSSVRWNRNPGEVRAMLASSPDVANLADPKTGNTPMHIAAQNGHANLVAMLIEFKSAVNTQNLKGQTPMHMAVGYDYYEVVELLLAAGADENLTNAAGFPANAGLDGDKSIGFAALISSKTKEEAEKAFVLLERNPGKLSKADFVKTGLRLKKEIGEGWPQDSFKAILLKL